MQIQEIDVTKLAANPWNPNELGEEETKAMARRMKETGKVEKPLTVRLGKDLGGATHQIIDGEQTWRAAVAAGLKTVPCIIEQLDDVQAIALTYVKNITGTMNPVKVGQSIKRMKAMQKDLSNGQIAKMFSKSEGSIRNYEFYAEAAERCGKVEGWPDLTEIAQMKVQEIRDLMKEGQTVPAAKPADGDAAEGAGDDVTKVLDKIFKALDKLDKDGWNKVRSECNRRIRETAKQGSLPLEGEAA